MGSFATSFYILRKDIILSDKSCHSNTLLFN